MSIQDKHKESVADTLRYYLSKYANDFIILLDQDFRFIEFNERVVDFYGYSRDELMGMYAPQVRAPEVRESFLQQISLAKDGAIALYETMHQTKDGKKFPVEINLRAIDVDGKRSYQAVIRDITERKRLASFTSMPEYFDRHL